MANAIIEPSIAQALSEPSPPADGFWALLGLGLQPGHKPQCIIALQQPAFGVTELIISEAGDGLRYRPQGIIASKQHLGKLPSKPNQSSTLPTARAVEISFGGGLLCLSPH